MKFITNALLILSIGLISACDWVSVPPTAKGKVLTTAGYSPDVLAPGKYTLWGRDHLVLLETNTNTYKEIVHVVLADKLSLDVEIRFRGRIAGSDAVIKAMFNDIKPGKDMTVSFDEVYAVYGKMSVRNKTREIISKYNVNDVHKNYARLSAEIGTVLIDALATTPLEISYVALGNIAYPQVVTDAINTAKERELSIKKEEFQASIDLTRKKNARILAEADYQIQITNAKAIRDKNKIIGEGVTPALIELRRLEVLEKMADNKAAVFMPVEAMTNTGAQMRMFAEK